MIQNDFKLVSELSQEYPTPNERRAFSDGFDEGFAHAIEQIKEVMLIYRSLLNSYAEVPMRRREEVAGHVASATNKLNAIEDLLGKPLTKNPHDI